MNDSAPAVDFLSAAGYVFLLHAAFASAVYATANQSVRPSVRPSHSGIVSKRGNAEECGLYHRVAQCL